MDDVVVRVVDLPTTVRGFTVYSPDCVANIYINSHMSQEQQQRTLAHEMRHVKRGDCFAPVTAREVER